MSGDYTSNELKRARALGLKFFKKPFDIEEVFEWLDKVARNKHQDIQSSDREELLN